MADFFSVSESAQDFECDGVHVRVLKLDSKARLLLKPVFKLIWRKSTFPLARWLYVAAMQDQIAEAIRGADVVHFFGNGPEMLGFASEAATRKAGARFVVEPALHEGQWGDKWFDALLYKRADLLLAHTRYEAGVLERMGIEATKIRTIVHGVDFCDSGDGERFRKKHGIAGPMVLFLGRKTREKGVGRLLEAWPMVAEKFPEATLVLAGPKSEALRPMADGGWRMVEEKGLTTENTENTEGAQGYAQGTCAGASESDSLASELADAPVSESLIRSADDPALARLAPRGVGVMGDQLDHSGEGQSQAGLQMDFKNSNPLLAGERQPFGQNSSSVSVKSVVLILRLSTLDARRSTQRRNGLDDLAEGRKAGCFGGL